MSCWATVYICTDMHESNVSVTEVIRYWMPTDVLWCERWYHVWVCINNIYLSWRNDRLGRDPHIGVVVPIVIRQLLHRFTLVAMEVIPEQTALLECQLAPDLMNLLHPCSSCCRSQSDERTPRAARRETARRSWTQFSCWIHLVSTTTGVSRWRLRPSMARGTTGVRGTARSCRRGMPCRFGPCHRSRSTDCASAWTRPFCFSRTQKCHVQGVSRDFESTAKAYTLCKKLSKKRHGF